MKEPAEPKQAKGKQIENAKTSNKPAEGWSRWTLYIIGSLGIGAIGGLIFNWITVPLPWMIGPMVFSTAAALAKVPIRGSKRLRSMVIPVLGVMLGSSFTPETIDHVYTWIPSIILMLIFVLIVISIVSVYLHQVMGFGPVSAYFSATPGGLATMVIIGGEMGGDERRIGLTHSIRILLTVLIIPIYFRTFEGYVPDGLGSLGSAIDLSIVDAVVLLACMLGFPLFKLLGLPSAQILGPMILSAIFHGSGLTEAKPPTEIVNIAQLIIGISVGARFVGVSILRLYKTMVAGAGATIFMVTLAAAAAWLISTWTGLPFAAVWLAFAPGGLAEMTLISLALGIDVAFVSTHHVVRVVFMVVAAPIVFNILERRFKLKETASQHTL